MFGILSQLGQRKTLSRPSMPSQAPRSPSEGGPPSLSFAGCAWLFPYHLGAIEAFRQEPAFADALYLGASSGSLAAVAAALGMDTEKIMDHTLRFARDSRERRLGPVGRMTRYVSQGLQDQLPDNASQLAAGRVKISVTRLPRLQHELIDVGVCQNRNDLIRLLLGSCYIPIYYERPVNWSGRWLIDGGLRNNQPMLNQNTVRILPQGARQGQADIYPTVPAPVSEILFPEPARLRALYEAGRRDTETWLERVFHARSEV
jgi:hypothetical protein